MTPNPDMLPDDLVWSEGGHLSDIAIAALGDGQDAIVPEKARDHALTCDSCAAQMGHAAMLSSELGAVMRAPIPGPALLPEGERAPVPWLAIIAALLVAAVGSLSSFIENPIALTESPNAFVRESSLAFHAGSALFHGIANGLGPLLSFGCAAILFGAGAVVARSMPRTWAE
ncbi:MAG: hypothetical protein ABI183_24165 [Polyangiaceae bacterium]